MTSEQLAQLGMQLWDESGLMLFPVHWFWSIPEGYEVVVVTGRKERFSKSWPDGKRDQRYGFLAFGIVARLPS